MLARALEPDVAAPRRKLVLALALALAGGIFALDTLTREPFAVAVLYVLVLLITAGTGQKRWIWRIAALCFLLTGLSFVLAHGPEAIGPPLMRCLVSLAAISAATVLVVRDVAAARRLREQSRLLDQTHDSVCVRDMDGKITYWNQGARSLYGWTAQEARGRDLQDLLQSRLPASPEAVMAELIASGAWSGEIVQRDRQDRELTVHSRWSLLRDDDGRPLSILETANDITGRRSADQAVRRSEARYRTIFETTSVSIWECDFSRVTETIRDLSQAGMADLREYMARHPGFVREAIGMTVSLDVNHASVALFGARDKAELIGAVDRIWPPEGERAFAEAMVAGWRDQPLFETEAVLQTLDGRRLDVLFSVAFPPCTERRDSIFVSLIDVTARNQTQAMLQRAQAELAHASRVSSLGQLTASIAHEVNQPLAGILSNGQAGLRWLRRSEPNLEATEASLVQVVDDAKRAAAVLDRVRGLARNSEPRHEQLDLNSLVEETAQLLQPELRRNQVELVMTLDPAAPTAAGDRVQVQQVVLNLMINAIHAMADTSGARTLSVLTRSHDGGELVEICVRDTGPGISEAVRARLFTPFYTTKPEGLGMGLSICESIARAHGGRITLDTSEGAGAKFSFCLPLQREEPAT